ncbi:MAG TPA: glycoside hydrolase family 15 protein [Paracoccus sp. (in: a-proteobacteria)]|uniref:glycoside hydrolase family 15 protein n=1 Tax=Paracoccus sp. TaxID=267 RepID=UPI002C808680|nr:glycoside hydrolase family 15 protein [Paracoccus sp. (in: a-proteobacteria)]HWL58520.1 glycoside hydrolase family 15 protein [Paracoccus sp. (in: a-proteobacteria)]
MAGPDPDWIAAQRLASAQAMRNACSATHLSRPRQGFGWTVRPAAGSVLASPRIASWDPEPDYFHHWIRDSAIVLRAVPLAIAADPASRLFWLRFVADFIQFSLTISDPDRIGPRTNPLRATTLPSHKKFLRPDAELAALKGDGWLEEPRFAADGGPDLEEWGRPQDDGPALRASAMMGVLDALPELASPKAEELIARDLAHVLQTAARPSIGPWEEAPLRRTTFTLIVQWDALDRGRRRYSDDAMQRAADRVQSVMDQAKDGPSGGWRESVEASEGRLDSATCLAFLHAGRLEGPFAITAARTRATAAALEQEFARVYPMNRDRDVPAIGRWVGDNYFDGNPWYPTTLGFAELHYRIAAESLDRLAFAKAEGWMRLIQQVAPQPAGPLPEQFDRVTGAPRSSLNLTWSAAAFLEAAAARQTAIQAMAGAADRGR